MMARREVSTTQIEDCLARHLLVCVDDVLDLDTAVNSFLQRRQNSTQKVNDSTDRTIKVAYSDGLAGSMITASFDFSSVTR